MMSILCEKRTREQEPLCLYFIIYKYIALIHVFYIHINHINLLNIKANIALPNKIFVFNTVQMSFMDILKMIICASNTLVCVPAFKSNSKVKVESKL